MSPSALQMPYQTETKSKGPDTSIGEPAMRRKLLKMLSCQCDLSRSSCGFPTAKTTHRGASSHICASSYIQRFCWQMAIKGRSKRLLICLSKQAQVSRIQAVETGAPPRGSLSMVGHLICRPTTTTGFVLQLAKSLTGPH